MQLGRVGFNSLTVIMEADMTQSPFGCSKLEPSALTLKRTWDLNGVVIIKAASAKFCRCGVHPV